MDSIYITLLVHLFWTVSPKWVYVRTGTSDYLFELKNNAIVFNSENISSFKISGELPKTVIIEGDNGTYRGDILIQKGKDGILIFNKIGIDDFLSSVIGGLDPPDTNIESLKARAIAVRSWICSNFKYSHGIIPDSTDLFVYRGIKAETSKTIKAVSDTRYIILTFEGNVIYPLWTHSTGGETVPYNEVFEENREYLISVPDPFSKKSPFFEWESSIWEYSFLRGVGMLDLDSMKIIKKSLHGIAEDIVLFGPNLQHLRGIEIYELFPDKIFSPSFRVQYSGDSLYFIGKGKGYLVGLSLWGAREMAERGKNYKEILEYYFPGCILRQRRRP